MFRILSPDQFVSSPWKNGGGVTHEIAREEANGGWLWRLSIAEVASDGPFSKFEGLSRILTVIEGNGIELHSQEGAIHAPLLKPVHFSGDLPVEGKLIDGPIRDLNVIFDARFVDADVEIISGPNLVDQRATLTGFLCLSGMVMIGKETVPVGAFALGDCDVVQVSEGASGVLVRLNRRS